MKKILFYTQNRWAFGAIHHGLAKELYLHGIYSNLLDWTQSYSTDEWKLLSDTYDEFVTMPDAVMALNSHGIPLSRIKTIAHGQWDILLAKEHSDFDFYPMLAGFGVISNILQKKCAEWEISRVPDVVEIGIHCDHFWAEPVEKMESIGYAGSDEVINRWGVPIKRPHLVEKICGDLGIPMVRHQFYNHLCMPAYYRRVDAVICSSIEEAAGLPMMECAAAGRLPVGTPVGYFEEHAGLGGVQVPMEEVEFVEMSKAVISFYKHNPSTLRSHAAAFQQYAKDHYDWSKRIYKWVDFLNK